LQARSLTPASSPPPQQLAFTGEELFYRGAQSSGYVSLESMKILRVLTDVWLPEFKFGPACVRATDMLGLAWFCA
jgi:hypothetical protein